MSINSYLRVFAFSLFHFYFIYTTQKFYAFSSTIAYLNVQTRLSNFGKNFFTFDLTTKKLTVDKITNNNIIELSIYPPTIDFNAHNLYIELQSRHINKKFRIKERTFSLSLPIAELYNISLFYNDKLVEKFSLDVKTKDPSSPDSFIQCNTTTISPRCWIYNTCINQDQFEFFGFMDLDFDLNFSVLLNPNVNTVKLSINRVPGTPSALSNITSIFADINSTGVFYHSTIEAVFPLLTLIIDENILNQPKQLILKKRSNTNFAQLRFLNLNVNILTNRQCFSKLLVGLPTSFQSSYHRRHLLPNIYNEQNRKRYRDVYYNYLYQKVDYPPTKTKYILFLNRPKSSHRSVLNHCQIMSTILSEFPDYVAYYTDFTGLDIKRQIDLIFHADILIAIHGSGLAHLLLLKDTALIIEIAPYLFGNYCNLFGALANYTNIKLVKLTVSKNSTFPVSVQMMNELEQNPALIQQFPHRKNIRDSNLVLNQDEIESLLQIIKKYPN